MADDCCGALYAWLFADEMEVRWRAKTWGEKCEREKNISDEGVGAAI